MAGIGLVTVFFNSDDVLEGFFRSVSAQSCRDYILYLIDNSPSPATSAKIEQLAQRFPVAKYEHIISPGNIGVAAGNNEGIKRAIAAGCSHVILLNNDIEFDQATVFDDLLSVCRQEQVAMATPKIFYYDTRLLWMAGGHMDTWRALGVHDGYNKPDAPAYNVQKRISYAPTCFMIIDTAVFAKIGLMDEKYFAYYDDTDFVLRATRAGYSLLYVPGVSILHKVSSSAGTNSPFYVYYSNRNKLYFIRKNLHGIRRYFAIAYTLLSRIIFWLRYDKTRKQKLVQGLKDGFKLKVEFGE